MYIIFDTETTGLPKNFKAPITDTDNWPRLVQLAWQIHDKKGDLVKVENYIIKPEGFTIPYNSQKIHGISTERALKQGVDLDVVLKAFQKDLESCQISVGHNISFDNAIMGCEFYRRSIENSVERIKSVDTKDETIDFCALPGGKGGRFKWPTLSELYLKLFNTSFEEAHNASADVEATSRCFLELVRLSVIAHQKVDLSDEEFQAFKASNPEPFELIGLNIKPYDPNQLDGKEEAVEEKEVIQNIDIRSNRKLLNDALFTHLHIHSQFSVLQSTTTISDIINYAQDHKLKAIGISDRGNLMAAFAFVEGIRKANSSNQKKKEEAEEKGEGFDYQEITPIVGSEFNYCQDHQNKNQKDNGYQVLLYAKNRKGFFNLSKLSSISHVDGFYYIPRIDKDLIVKYKSDLVALTGGMYGFLASMILNEGLEKAEKELLWWKEHFGEDLYIEIGRHGLEEEQVLNEELVKLSNKYQIKLIAANDTFYTHKNQSNAHDILLCIKDGEKQQTPKGRGRGFRYGMTGEEYYLKTPEQMKDLFVDLPESILTIEEMVNKFEPYPLKRDTLLPAFDIPEEFVDKADEIDGGKRGENAFLRHITYLGAEKRYETITDEIRERIDFELQVIENTGYPGYFLIVQDFTTEARKMGVSVGPGRGSAAGSVVAYCTGITNVDPIKYDLLFERFLNPDRVSLPDIDIDFDDLGRDKIIQWVIDKYGANQVAQIITYGKMAAKSSIRDTGRVLDYPLDQTNALTKLVPLNAKLGLCFSNDDEKIKSKFKGEDLALINELKNQRALPGEVGKVLEQAEVIEGSLRNTGVHACGVIITPDDITNFVPVTTGKGTDMYLTQYDNAVVESAGLLKMDFLGLKTLTIINEAIRLVKKRHDIDINPDDIPLDDPLTFELYQRGETNGTFQFESAGMQKHLRGLKPDKFEDLIAMNALYRPGPMEFIPDFINRKIGKSEIEYDLPEMEEFLKETYGITVYQEQVMLLSQKLAGFSKGDADTLRKAMGKKILSLLATLRPKFMTGGKERGFDEKILLKIWNSWESFASYAFNKSHSTCYSFIAYHTGYLKANYPPEFMASVLTNNSKDIKKITFYMSECKRMGLEVLSPDVNESELNFTVNANGGIRFGLSAIKGVGEGAARSLIEERTQNGEFKDIFDFVKRVDLRTVNKRTMENLVYAGAFDEFSEVHRGVFFFEDHKGETFLSQITKFGTQYKAYLQAPADLFGGSEEFAIPNPKIPEVPEMDTLHALRLEKEVVGVYISSHPLDTYRFEVQHTSNALLSDFDEGEPQGASPAEGEEVDLEAQKLAELERQEQVKKLRSKTFSVACQVVDHQERITKNGKPFGIFMAEDYSGQKEFFVFGEQYTTIKGYLVAGSYILLKLKYQPDRFKPDQYRLNILSACFLADVFSKFYKGLEIEIDLQQLDDEVIAQVSDLAEEHQGDKVLRLKIKDSARKKSVKLHSRTKRIALSRELLEALENYPSLKARLKE
ncbi:MAG: DNA polymerase III subunit alpha [Flavobacteriales bacterium]